MEYIVGVHRPWTRAPDCTIYLDVDPETGAARSGATNKFEQAGFLSHVQSNYERLIDADPGRFTRVDATQSPEGVVESVVSAIDHLLDESE
jgi:dTMP kinase